MRGRKYRKGEREKRKREKREREGEIVRKIERDQKTKTERDGE
jgi:hypothetical protein